MKLNNWWRQSTPYKIVACSPLKSAISTDYVVIGGGFAGLHAALYLKESGKDVVLIEKDVCGGSASGKSSGFITPDSEFSLSQFQRRYGLQGAKIVWQIPNLGVKEISRNVKKYRINCDFEKQESVFLSMGKSVMEEIQEESKACKKMHVSHKVYNAFNLKEIINTTYYGAALQTSGTYSMNAFSYCQGLKQILARKGVRIFEHSPVIHIKGNMVSTLEGTVQANKIISCMDVVPSSLRKIRRKAYHAQTFLVISEPLTSAQIKSIFPGKKCMCWDSKLVYTYFRLTKDNRILVGGGSPLTTYSPREMKSARIPSKLVKEIKSIFPQLKNINFSFYWPGLISISKDIMPIVDRDDHNSHMYYVLGNPGLPWATFCGIYAAKKALSNNQSTKYDKYLKSSRKFFISDNLQKFLRKIPSFSINNLYSMYRQQGY
jgi:gamma-glutamylputrescine oxidase